MLTCRSLRVALDSCCSWPALGLSCHSCQYRLPCHQPRLTWPVSQSLPPGSVLIIVLLPPQVDPHDLVLGGGGGGVIAAAPPGVAAPEAAMFLQEFWEACSWAVKAWTGCCFAQGQGTVHGTCMEHASCICLASGGRPCVCWDNGGSYLHRESEAPGAASSQLLQALAALRRAAGKPADLDHRRGLLVTPFEVLFCHHNNVKSWENAARHLAGQGTSSCS